MLIIRRTKNPRSRKSGTSLCVGKLPRSDMRRFAYSDPLIPRLRMVVPSISAVFLFPVVPFAVLPFWHRACVIMNPAPCVAVLANTPLRKLRVPFRGPRQVPRFSLSELGSAARRGQLARTTLRHQPTASAATYRNRMTDSSPRTCEGRRLEARP